MSVVSLLLPSDVSYVKLDPNTDTELDASEDNTELMKVNKNHCILIFQMDLRN